MDSVYGLLLLETVCSTGSANLGQKGTVNLDDTTLMGLIDEDMAKKTL